MQFGQPARPAYTPTQLMTGAWLVVAATALVAVCAVAFVASIDRAPDAWSRLAPQGLLVSWLCLAGLTARHTYRLQRTTWLWLAVLVFTMPVGPLLVATKLFVDTRRYCRDLAAV